MRKQELSVEQWIALCEEGVYNTVKIPLHGESMCPLVRMDKDFVVVAPLSRTVKKGDVVLFRRIDGAWVVHRVLMCKKDKAQTIGDGCLYPDVPISADDVVGLIIKIERGKFSLSIDNKFWRMLGILWIKLLPLRKIFLAGCGVLMSFRKRLFNGSKL